MRKEKCINGWSRYSDMSGITTDIEIAANIKLPKCLNLQVLCYLKLLEVKYSQIRLLIFCSQNSLIVIFTISRS